MAVRYLEMRARIGTVYFDTMRETDRDREIQKAKEREEGVKGWRRDRVTDGVRGIGVLACCRQVR